MKKFLSFIWQLPQNLLGIAAVLLLDACRQTFCSAPPVWTHYKTLFSSVSLGDYIIVNGYSVTDRTILHERGHQRQSRILGWLYLPLIGLSSLCGNILHRFVKFDYYKQPWEKSADKLGGVKR